MGIKHRYNGKNEIAFEGQIIVVDYHAKISPGDAYVAQKNTGLKILTCKNVDPRGWVNPVEIAYSFDIHDCAKIIDIK